MEAIVVPPVRYTTTADGMNIAYLVAGEGRTLVFLPFHHSHLERRWKAGGAPGWHRPLAESNLLVTYDSRGQGLSSRNLERDPTLSDYQQDLGTVLQAAGVRSCVLVAYGGFAHVALEYAATNPSAVEGLVLICTSESFSSWPVAGMLALAEENWDLLLEFEASKVPEPFHDVWLSFLKASTTGADYARLVRAFSESNVADLLPLIAVPVLVLHSLDQHWLSVEDGTRFASGVPGARLVFLNGDAEPNDVEGIRAMNEFLGMLPDKPTRASAGSGDGSTALLSSRELEVLHLLHAGKSNQQIADELVISLHTVRRHVSHIFDKTGVANRTEAAGYAREHGLA
jgi:DNA-binding CsgD family transcriptional regulator/pimeloyl-ACP methyl ester carboxylesterase